MGKLVRKNLTLDPDALKELARRRGTSESEAVREAIKHSLAADEIEEIVREFNRRGGIDLTEFPAGAGADRG